MPTSPITAETVRKVFSQRVKKDGKGFTTFCPVHESPPNGHTPSLHVEWNAPHQKTLVVCRTQDCSKEKIASTLGLDLTTMLNRLEGKKGASSPSHPPTKRKRFTLIAPARPLDVDLDDYPIASDSQITRLAEDRKLPTEALTPWGIRCNRQTREYLFPVYTPDGILTDLRRYQIPGKGEGKLPVKAWRGARVGLMGAERLPSSPDELVYICAGEWDAMAMQWLLTKLEKQGIVLSLPGENNFQQTWARWFTGRVVHTLLDHDQAGRNGELKIADALARVVEQVTFTHWPETLPDKYDVRDWVIAGALKKQKPQACYDHLMAMQQPVPRLRPSLPPDINHLLTKTTFRRSDAGNAEYLVKVHGRNLRHHTEYDSWMHWQEDEQYWRHVGVKQKPFALVTDAMRQRLDESTTKKDRAWALGSESRSRMSNALAIAASYQGLQVGVNHFNRHPDLLAVANGVVDLRNGQLRPQHRDDYISFRCPHPYDPDATCPRWERFLTEVFPWKLLKQLVPDDDETTDASTFIQWFQRAIGYSLTGRTQEHKFFLPYGSGRNGKSTALNAVSYALGGPSVSTDDYKDLPPIHPGYAHVMSFAAIEKKRGGGEPYELASLPGRRFVSLTEAEKDARFNEATLKRLTGGDPFNARPIYGSPMTFVPVAKFWIAVNDLPRTDDHSHAFWSRVCVIPFLQQFKINRTLTDTLCHEAPGILAWAVRGAIDWFNVGLGTNAIVNRATAEYRSDANPLTRFVSETCEHVEGHVTSLKHLFDAYHRWAKEEGVQDRHQWTRHRLSRDLKPTYRKVETAGKNKDQTGFVGLRLKDRYRPKSIERSK